MTQNYIRHHPWLMVSHHAYLLGKHGFLISDVSTLSIVCYVAAKLWYKTQFPPATWVIVLLLWLLTSIGTEIWVESAERRSNSVISKWLTPILAVSICALVMKVFADPFSWRQTSAFGFMFAAALGVNHLILGLIARTRETDRWEGLRFGIAQGAALFAVHPYIRSGLLGAGDATSYSLMIADFLEQWHSGIFPIFIGQSWFAFNGGFQPIRNAPYFQHLACFFDLFSLGTLNVFALQNLTVLASMLGGLLGCFAALRISLSKDPWLALMLAILYGLCPGVLAPLYSGDMYITFMTLPSIPWLVLGLEQSSALPDRIWPWALQGAALAAMWLAHPPVAAWATLIAAIAGLWIIIRERRGKVFGRMILALAIFLALSGYLFVSVSSLRLPVVSRDDALGSIAYKVAILRDNWVNSFLPVSQEGNQLLGDVQLGYGLWVCLLLAVAGAVRARSGRSLLGCFALILLFAWPIPILTRCAWRSLPSELLLVTNQWPMERFYVLLAGLAVFIIASAFSRYSSRGFWQRLSVAMLLLSACLWSTAETWKFFRRAAAISHSESASEDMHRRENITLSRTHSYEYLGMPAYFSNGHMDPRLETRLLDMETLQVFADGSTYRSESTKAVSEPYTFALQKRRDGVFTESVHVEPGQACVLRFDFLGQRPEGEFQITGESLSNLYSLPQSGLSKSFGSGPEAAHALILEDSTNKAEKISFRFVGQDSDNAGEIFARVSVEPLSEQERAIRLASLTPFHAFVAANRDCYLETPKLYVPGYNAFVDGTSAAFTRSSSGLIAIPLSKGEHDVSLIYAGSRLLRWSYNSSAAAWLVLLVIVGAYALGSEQIFAPWIAKIRLFRIKSLWEKAWSSMYARSLLGAVVLAVAIGLWLSAGLFPQVGYGDVQMLIKLPGPLIGRSEPLVTTGRSGAGDFIYITYVDGRHVIVGHDKWNYGGGRSAPIAVDYAKPQKIEISLSSFYPDAHSAKENNYAARGLHYSKQKVSVKWNGVLVLSEDAVAHPSKPNEVTFGENTIGGSTTLRYFSGDILNVARVDPAGLK